jgi:hypothetical protein
MNFTTLRTLCAILLSALLLAGCATASGSQAPSAPLSEKEGRWLPVDMVLNQPIPHEYRAYIHKTGTSLGKVFIGSVTYNQFWLYVDGKMALHGPLATGSTQRGYATAIGTHKILWKKGLGYKSKTYPKPYGGARMDFALFFTADGQAIHASDNYQTRFSQVSQSKIEEVRVNWSHGCANLRFNDAQIVNSYLDVGDTVIILK